MKRVVVILSGCGVMDGSEIHESVLTLLALDRAKAEIIVSAPDIPQRHVINHQTGQPDETQTRRVLEESARIARGAVKKLDEIKDFDAVILPGGFGAAKNLSTFALEGEKFSVDPALETFLRKAHEQQKSLGFICIAPAIAAKLFGSEGIQFTIGTDTGTAKTLESFGGQHIDCPVDDVVVDEKNKIVTTPAYMLAERISEAEAGISKLVEKLLEL